MQVNFLGPIRLTLALLPQMIERGAGQHRQRLVGGGHALVAGRGGVRRVEVGAGGVLRGDGDRPLGQRGQGARRLPGRRRHAAVPDARQRPVHRAGRVHHRRRARRRRRSTPSTAARSRCTSPSTSRTSSPGRRTTSKASCRDRRVHAPADRGRLNDRDGASARPAHGRRDQRRGRAHHRRRPLRGRLRVRARAPARAGQGRRCSRTNPARPSTGRSRRCSSRPDASRRSRWSCRSPRARSVRGRCTTGMRPALLFGESFARDHRRARSTPTGRRRCAGAASPTSTRCRSTRGPPGIFGSPHEDGPPHQPLHLATSATSRPTTATPGRSRACSRSSTSARGEVLEVVDLGVVPMPPERGQRTSPRTIGPLRDRPPAARDHPARRPELHASTATSCSGSAGRSGSASTRSRAWCCTPSATTTAAASGRSCTARRSARWSCPTATPARCTAGRTRSTPASGASAAWPTR